MGLARTTSLAGLAEVEAAEPIVLCLIDLQGKLPFFAGRLALRATRPRRRCFVRLAPPPPFLEAPRATCFSNVVQ